MSSVESGVIRDLSVTQIESFDHTQTGGCERKWWFERAMGLRPDQNKAQGEGEAGHTLLAEYLKTGAIPGRTLMGKAVRGVIAKGELPKPGPDLLVEIRFDGQPKHGPAGEWLPLDRAETLHLAGVPLDGFLDLAFRRTEIPEIWDHKFFTPARPDLSPDPYVWLKKPSQLIKTVQMPVYVLSQLPYWPDAKFWRIAHHCVSKNGVDSQLRAAIVSTAEVLERKAEIEAVIERMKVVAQATDQRDVPHNLKSCSAWQGCPHQSICSAFKEKPKMDLTPEEIAMFDDLNTVAVETAPAAPAPVDPPPAAPPAPPKRRAGQIIDMTGQAEEAVPNPAPSVTAEAVAPACKCGTPITVHNGSKLQSGEWMHVGCKLDAPPAEPPKPKARKPAPQAKPAETAPATPAPVNPVAHADSPKVTTPPLAAPAFLGERDSDRGAEAALEAMKAARAQKAAPVDVPSNLVLADLFQNISTLLRKI